jgi:hypothetical protein
MLGGPIDESVEILSELKEKGVLLYILSNWSAETYPIAEERFDFLNWFDGKIISGEAGIVKPDLEIILQSNQFKKSKRSSAIGYVSADQLLRIYNNTPFSFNSDNISTDSSIGPPSISSQR